MNLENMRGGLIVSCQASKGDPLDDAAIMLAMAESAIIGGAVGIRTQGLRDIAYMRPKIAVPIIGLWKDGHDPVFITPTLRHALAVSEAGADIIAIDGTRRPRPDGRTLADTIEVLHVKTGKPVLADVGSITDGIAAWEAGADYVATTLSGYTEEVDFSELPDLRLVELLANELPIPVVAEGRISTPEQARSALDRGAFAVVVGTAITRTNIVTSWFTRELSMPKTTRGEEGARP